MMKNVKCVLLLFLLSLLPEGHGADATEAGGTDNPIEAGTVNWSRDFDGALQTSGETGKPVFVLFQEIPGCIGCRTFGSEVLSEPLLVEAIESEFIPVLVYNNRPGTNDAEILQRYREPAWNYQVIRFLTSDGKDIIPRKDRIWTISGVITRMIKTLETLHRPVPLYLHSIMLEHDRKNHKTAGFAMACFWTGEYTLGKIEGVIATEAGWYDNREVTLVTYHSEILSLQQLVERAAQKKCADRVYIPAGEHLDNTRLPVQTLRMDSYRRASSSDQKKQLESWPAIKSIETLSPMQATKINSLAPVDPALARMWLSPRQLQKLREYAQ